MKSRKYLKFVFIFTLFITIYHLSNTIKAHLCVKKDYMNQLIETAEREIDFKEDVLAFMHIQKTSGTNFEESISSNLMVKTNDSWKPACRHYHLFKRMVCVLNNHGRSFIWDKYTNKRCDMHADYTELLNCIMHEYNNRIFDTGFGGRFYGVIHIVTMLRDPIARYISEYHHVKREGLVWQKSVRLCKKEALFGKNCNDWKNATWSDFLSCEYNQANNRQTRMLANYNQLGCRILKCWTNDGNCSETKKRLNDKIILQSAKQTLMSLSFFGLTEYQQLSQYLFEKTFKDKIKFSQQLSENKKKTYETSEEYTSIDRIKQNNYLDIELYEFAKTLFFKRIEYFKYRHRLKQD